MKKRISEKILKNKQIFAIYMRLKDIPGANQIVLSKNAKNICHFCCCSFLVSIMYGWSLKRRGYIGKKDWSNNHLKFTDTTMQKTGLWNKDDNHYHSFYYPKNQVQVGIVKSGYARCSTVKSFCITWQMNWTSNRILLMKSERLISTSYLNRQILWC